MAAVGGTAREEYRLPKVKPAREAYAVQIGQDGLTLLESLTREPAGGTLRQRSSVEILQRVWSHHYERTEQGCHWRSMQELPSVAERLIGPVRENSSWQAKVNQGYNPTHFQIHWDEQQVICPQGKISTKWRPEQDAFGNDVINLQFSRSDRKQCPARSLCTRSQKTPRHLVLHPREQ